MVETGCSRNSEAKDEAETSERVEAAARSLEALTKQYVPNVSAETAVLAGNPAEAIVAFAGSTADRIIMMPTRGYGSFRRMLLGSVAAKVLHDAMCPVWMGAHLENAIIPTEQFDLKPSLCGVSRDWETDAVLKQLGRVSDISRRGANGLHVVAPSKASCRC